ncbi:MAG: CHASE3 domain-containing protein [Acidobacteriaceae bacterium]|nr:CHASE3 domain-containing protein [Acidobacteriaceae bacterium]
MEKSNGRGLLKRTQFFLIALAAVPLLLALVTYYASVQHAKSVAAALATGEFILSLDDLYSTVQDAETGQRGYLITGSGLYLAPYLRAKDQVRENLATAMSLASLAGVHFPHWRALQAAIDDKMDELELTLKLRDSGKPDAALDQVRTNRGQQHMAQIREIIGQLKAEQVQVYERRDQEQLLREKRLRIILSMGVVLAIALLLCAFRLGILYLRERDQAEAEILDLYERLELRVLERTAELEARTRFSEAQAKELERSNADLAQFASIASHDLQEPLRMVASYVGMLSKRYGTSLDDTARTYMQFAVDGASRMQALINDLLSYARAGTQAITRAQVPFERVMERALASLRLTIEETSAIIDYGHLPVVELDELKMTQVIQNLFSNAIKFRKNGTPPQISVSAERRGADWLFSVADNGIGFDPKYHDRIFEVFQRLHGLGRYAGNGIGLSICRRIIEHHGGRLWADSKPGEGSTFFFTLPAGEEFRSEWRSARIHKENR